MITNWQDVIADAPDDVLLQAVKTRGYTVRKQHAKYTEDAIREARKLYYEGAPTSVIEERTGIPYKYHHKIAEGPDRPCRITRNKLRATWVQNNADWSMLDGIKPVNGIPGYSALTREEGQRIKEFYNAHPYIRAIEIARHFNVRGSLITGVLNDSHNYTRKSKPTALGKKIYQMRKKESEQLRYGRR